MFPLSDLRVDLTKSDEKILSLKTLSVQSSGQFMCEVILLKIYLKVTERVRCLKVSTEGPRFRTLAVDSVMVVVQVPLNPPTRVELRHEKLFIF